ncbi:hypothetical protein BDV93DRAFT_46037 [Ceratobasidium sp. AG-I]|nr:hypothetical protein BDV93DRAFT_46037 [Ceratobasidium sp. AG-I]
MLSDYPLGDYKQLTSPVRVNIVVQDLIHTKMYSPPATPGEPSGIQKPDAVSFDFESEICQACYAARRSCVYRGDVKHGCQRCLSKGKTCRPRERSTSSDKVSRNLRAQLEAKRRELDHLLTLHSLIIDDNRGQTDTSSDSPNTPNDPSPLRGPVLARTTEPRSPQRVPKLTRRSSSNPSGAAATIDAIHIAMSTSVVAEGFLRPSEVIELYHKFMTRWNPCILVLDPDFHTMEILAHADFLLSVVLAIAAQDYEPETHPGLYEKLVHRSRKIGVEEILNRNHNLETVQSFILLSLFPDWKAHDHQNRSWLDLGLAIDLARQMNLGQTADACNHSGASPSERNVLRTWMICHNLDIISTLLFDKPASLRGCPWPRDNHPSGNTADGSLESTVGKLTAPLQRIDEHLKHQASNNVFYGADLIPAMAGEHTGSPKLVDSEVISAMGKTLDEAETRKSSPQRFWSHLAHTTTEYSRLLLSSKYSSQETMGDPKTREQMLASAVSILQSYLDVSSDFNCSKYAPGSLFAFGVLASAVARKLSTPTDADFNNTSSLIGEFAKLLESSPAAGRTDSRPSIFISVLEQWVGGTSGRKEMRSREQAVSMMTSVFPAWWRLFL